jgi:hypothetical protein
MRAFTAAKTATCLAALVAGGAAQAQVTAQQVWDNWQQGMAIYGEGGVSIGSESLVGSSLTVTDLTLSMSDEVSTVSSTIPSIVFTERGDGTVSVVMSESYPVTITGTAGESATLLISQSGLEMVVSGDATAMTYDFTANKLSIELQEMRDATAVLAAEALMNFNTVSGAYTSTYGDLNVVAYDMAVGGVDILLDVNEESTGTLVNFSGQIADLSIGGEVGMPADMDMNAPETMFANGFYVDAGYSFGQSAYLFSFADSTGSASGSATIGAGELGLGMDFDGVGYSNALSGVAVSVTASDLPFPVDLSMAEYGVGLSLPLSQTDVPQDFSASFGLVDLVISDGIWGMIDPAASLPRDPATLIIALSGTGNLFFDLLDPAQAMAIQQAAVPGAINTIALDELTLQALGAEVLGEGSFVFDNNDMTTFPGFPRPEGTLNIAINGANALIDKLVAMGLLPEDQVMGARMMMGVFATPVGDDMLTSTIEVNAEGHVIANGQRLQ